MNVYLACREVDIAALTEALRRAIADRALRERLGAAGRAAYERRYEPGAAAHAMAAFFVRARSHGVKRPRRPWRRPHQGLEHRLTALIQDGVRTGLLGSGAIDLRAILA